MRVVTRLVPVLVLALPACSEEDDDEGDGGLTPTSDASTDARTPDANVLDASARDSGSIDANTPDIDARAVTADAAIADARAALIARGAYLTTVIFPCGGCHTPRNEPDKAFGGVDCWNDSVQADNDAGCISSKNLTNHETGIKNYSDQELRNLLTKGARPDGKALFSQMPYALLGNMSATDVDAMIAYLRSLAPIDHRVQTNQPPWDVPPTMAGPIWPQADIPQPRSDYPDRAAALRGRYLAGELGSCMDCHTPREGSMQLRSRAFQGGRAFGNAGGAPVYAPNLTPDPTGIAGWSVEDVVRAIKQGEDKNQQYSKFCGPMPSGPMGAYGAMDESDARDIAHYLLSLTPAAQLIPGDCQVLMDGGIFNPVSDAGR